MKCIRHVTTFFRCSIKDKRMAILKRASSLIIGNLEKFFLWCDNSKDQYFLSNPILFFAGGASLWPSTPTLLFVPVLLLLPSHHWDSSSSGIITDISKYDLFSMITSCFLQAMTPAYFYVLARSTEQTCCGSLQSQITTQIR